MIFSKIKLGVSYIWKQLKKAVKIEIINILTHGMWKGYSIECFFLFVCLFVLFVVFFSVKLLSLFSFDRRHLTIEISNFLENCIYLLLLQYYMHIFFSYFDDRELLLSNYHRLSAVRKSNTRKSLAFNQVCNMFDIVILLQFKSFVSEKLLPLRYIWIIFCIWQKNPPSLSWE